MLQVIKLSCNRELLGYLHSNGSMKSVRLQLFSLVQDLLQYQCCRKNNQQKRFKKNKKIFCIFEKSRRNKLIILIGICERVKLANICTPLLSTNWHYLLQILTFTDDLLANVYLNLMFSLIPTNKG